MESGWNQGCGRCRRTGVKEDKERGWEQVQAGGGLRDKGTNGKSWEPNVVGKWVGLGTGYVQDNLGRDRKEKG